MARSSRSVLMPAAAASCSHAQIGGERSVRQLHRGLQPARRVAAEVRPRRETVTMSGPAATRVQHLGRQVPAAVAGDVGDDLEVVAHPVAGGEQRVILCLVRRGEFAGEQIAGAMSFDVG